MKDKEQIITGVGIIICVAGLAFANVIHVAHAQNSPSKIAWFNDAVYYTTNSVYDRERMGKLTNDPSAFYYTKDVVTTNRVGSIYFSLGENRKIELGAREDGTIVWRYQE